MEMVPIDRKFKMNGMPEGLEVHRTTYLNNETHVFVTIHAIVFPFKVLDKIIV